MEEQQEQTIRFLTSSYGNLIAALVVMEKIKDESNEHSIYKKLLADIQSGNLTYEYAKKHILSRVFHLAKHNVEM